MWIAIDRLIEISINVAVIMTLETTATLTQSRNAYTRVYNERQLNTGC